MKGHVLEQLARIRIEIKKGNAALFGHIYRLKVDVGFHQRRFDHKFGNTGCADMARI